MHRIAIILAAVILICPGLPAQDYQYQFFAEEQRFLPFSDYIPEIRLHYQTVPYTVEDFYELYGKKLYYNENSLRVNIERLKIALERRFRHPSEALVPVETEEEYHKYRQLMHMRINLLIMRSYMRIASRYDKHRIKFYNVHFADEIKESLDIAEFFYKKAIPYWEEAERLAFDASNIRITTQLSQMESERYSIVHRELDFGRIINTHISRLDEKREQLDIYLEREAQR